MNQNLQKVLQIVEILRQGPQMNNPQQRALYNQAYQIYETIKTNPDEYITTHIQLLTHPQPGIRSTLLTFLNRFYLKEIKYIVY